MLIYLKNLVYFLCAFKFRLKLILKIQYIFEIINKILNLFK